VVNTRKFEGYTGGPSFKKVEGSSCVTTYKEFDIFFYVAPMVVAPTEKLIQQCDAVVVYKYSRTPVDFNFLNSLGNCLVIVVERFEEKHKILCVSKLTSVPPFLPSPPSFEEDDVKKFIIVKSINTHRYSVTHFQEYWKKRNRSLNA